MNASEVRALLDQQRYAELVGAVGDAAHRPVPDGGDEEVWTLLLRCRLEQGLIREAGALVDDARGRFAPDGVADLWSRLTEVYRNRAALTPRALDAFVAHCERIAARGASAPGLLAGDLRAQGLALRFLLSGQEPGRRTAVADAWESAADAYRDAGLPGDADRAVRRAASFLRGNPGADPARARDLLAAALEAAQRRGDGLSAAESAFARAELDLEVWFATDFGKPRGREPGPLVAALENAAERITAAGGRLGEPRAYLALGHLCLNHGVPDGVALTEKAANGFREARVPAQELTAWQALSQWHIHHGDAEARKNADQEAAALTRLIGHPLADDARAIGEADTAFRAGDRGRADLLTARRGPSEAGEFVGQAVVRASVLSAMGLGDEAVLLLREIDRELRDRPAPAGLLPEVSLSLAGLLADSDGPAARVHLERGAAAARRLGLPVDEARCLALEAWVAVLARRRGGTTLLSPEETAGLFDRATALLEPLTTLDARVHLVSVHQQRGQAAFFTQDWEECGTSLSRAEDLCRTLGLGPQLAFTLSYQALVLMDRARHGGGAALYEDADRRLAEVQGLLAAAGLRPEIWRVLFHRGICALETGDRYASTERDRARHWSRADTLLDEAAREVDRLRAAAATADTTALRTQHVRIALAGDTSEVYRLGFELHWYRRADAATALRWLERSKSRALLDGLGELTPPEPVLRQVPELAREQDLRKRPAATDAEELALRREIDGLLATMRTGPMAGYARARSVEPPAYEELRAALGEEERHTAGRRIVVAEYRCGPTGTLLFALRADWAAPRVETVAVDHARLSRYAAQYFRRPGGVRLMMQDLADGGERDWHSFSSLVAPLADWLSPGDILYLVPHGILHDLPLHTLPVAGEPLLLRNPVCYSPSSAVLLDLLNRTTRGERTRAGARSVFGDSRSDLPRSAEEAGAVARLLSVRERLGAEVTTARVLDALDACALVHLAGHGHLSTGDGFERGMDMADGVLRASDLVGRRVGAGTVVLSGCETGVNEQRTGDEPVGLTRALFLGGCRSVVVSQWKVADTSAAVLLTAFHRELAEGFGCADALHHAARAVAGTPPHRRHFYHWGAFVAAGDWR
ncbi:CHAT domain-containing protein [Streptomyces sp. NRRL S-37]|uniref:CHAT domain-containing protein n=1 Tax=Streptomyces sp. NRRL S-37 TaxID=1463903 RepID=UPI000AD696CA|nr:CHAT domain-containing protein [Streptomyces sp. NRRL S-37]